MSSLWYIIVFEDSKGNKKFKKVDINLFYVIVLFSNQNQYNFQPICEFYCEFSIHIIVLRNGQCRIKCFQAYIKYLKILLFFRAYGVYYLWEKQVHLKVHKTFIPLNQISFHKWSNIVFEGSWLLLRSIISM